jgi:polar amino acid transport system substrate-binding protein
VLDDGRIASLESIVTNVSPDVVKNLVPTGVLRAAINIGNPVLVQADPAGGTPTGVTMDLARELARHLGVALEPTVIDGAGKSFETLKAAKCDIGFLAIEPARAAEIAFTAPYVIIEGVYAVHADSTIKANADVDRAGVRIAVNKGAAYDLYLTRSLKHATLARSEESFEAFLRDKLDAVAGVKQAVVRFAAENKGVRVLDGRFMEIQQAMCLPKGRDAAARYLSGFVEEMKASGFVADALKRSNQPDATVAPPAA